MKERKSVKRRLRTAYAVKQDAQHREKATPPLNDAPLKAVEKATKELRIAAAKADIDEACSALGFQSATDHGG